MDAPPPSSPPPKPKAKAKNKNSYPHPPKKSSSSSSPRTAPPTIQPGDAGIWATCTKGKEGKATVDLLDLFAQFVEALYGIHDNIAPAPAPGSSTTPPSNGNGTLAPGTNEPTSPSSPTTNEPSKAEDIETSITAELSHLRGDPSPTNARSHPPKLIQPIRLSTPCLLFFRTLPPLDPVAFVTAICRHFYSPSPPSLSPSVVPLHPHPTPSPSRRQIRFAKRLTPTSLVGKATPASLVSTARTVLSAAGLTSPPPPTSPSSSTTDSNATFAIRPTIRDHHVLTRSQIIETVAPLVGEGWTVDLSNPGKVVCVEVWRNVCGVVVLRGQEWRGLGRFNLAEVGNGDKGAKAEGKGEGEGGKSLRGKGEGAKSLRGKGEGAKSLRGKGDKGLNGEGGETVDGVGTGGGGGGVEEVKAPLGGGDGGVVVKEGEKLVGAGESGGVPDGGKRKRDEGHGDGEEGRVVKVGREEVG